MRLPATSAEKTLAAALMAQEISKHSTCLAMLDKADFAPESVAQAIADPQFGRQKLISDWRNWVPDSIRAVWDSLPLEAKVAVYLIAEERDYNAEEEDE